MATADAFESAWPFTQDRDDLRLARLLKALAVGALEKDGRLADLEVLARALLQDHQDFQATYPYVPPWIPAIWDPRFEREGTCEQPRTASFSVNARYIAADSRDELASKLRSAAQEAGWCCEASLEADDDPAKYAAKTALDFMLGVYQKVRPALENDRLPAVAPEVPLSVLFQGGDHSTLSPRKKSAATRDLVTLYERFAPGQWGNPEVAERAVRAFLRALGMNKEQARSLFDAERKRDKREASKAPPTSSHTSEVGGDDDD